MKSDIWFFSWLGLGCLVQVYIEKHTEKSEYVKLSFDYMHFLKGLKKYIDTDCLGISHVKEKYWTGAVHQHCITMET